MKETSKTSRTAGYLEKMFRELNMHYFNNALEEPIITIQSTPKAYGHVTVSKTWRKGQTQRHELNIGAGTLDRAIEDIVTTLMHEMIHLYNIHIGVQDCSRSGTYHNKKFKKAALARDLDVFYHSKVGHGVTKPTAELCEFIITRGWQDIQMGRNESLFVSGTINTTSVKTSTRKYICPVCGNSVRATKEVNIMCMDCEVQMIT